MKIYDFLSLKNCILKKPFFQNNNTIVLELTNFDLFGTWVYLVLDAFNTTNREIIMFR